jgi:DNA repair protein RadC
MPTEQQCLPPDKRLVRAARSLYHNREAKEIAEARIERASDALVSYLGLAGLATARFGLFDVVLVDGQLTVTKLPDNDAEQLVLPEMEAGEHAIHEAAPLVAYGALPPQLHRLQPAPPATQVSFLAPEEAAFMHELRQLAARAVTIYDSTRPGTGYPESSPVMSSGAEVYAYLRAAMAELPQEQLRVLTMTLKNQLIGEYLLYQGTLNATTIRVAEVFRPAIVDHAAQIIVAHNHPSGDPTPSQDDIATTRQITQAGDLFDIKLLDHVIVARRGFASLKERGHIPR